MWEEFIHARGFGATHFAVLSHTYPSPLGTLEGYRYLQYASGVFGLAVLYWAWRRIPHWTPDPASNPRLARWAPVVVGLGGILAVLLSLTRTGWAGWRATGFTLVTSSIGGAVVARAVLCAVQVISLRSEA